jgi:excisionase family DNA binding protein
MIERRPTLTVEETAKLLGISRGLAFQAVRRGDIPAIRIGRRILVPLARLQALLNGDSADGTEAPSPEGRRGGVRCERPREAIRRDRVPWTGVRQVAADTGRGDAHVTMAEDREDVVTMGRRDFSKLLPGTRSLSVEELARQQGVRPVDSLDDMRAVLWESDEELEEFLADVRASRQADLG